MKKKLFALSAVLGLSVLASWAPQAEAVAYCNSSYCVGKPSTTKCGCPPETDRRGQASTCGTWNTVSSTGCWYGA
jgi:hypothetical protein